MSFTSEVDARDEGVAMLSFGKKVRGFTLIELMIVVAVVAILAAIAYPSFDEAVRKSRRGQAKADMVEVAQILERYHTEHNTYVGGEAFVPAQSPKTGVSRYALQAVTAQSAFTITATPEPSQSNDKCGDLTIDQAGAKGNSKGALADCW